ncbi:MAG: hypothetical protein ACE5GN_02275 [Waddliaceae bacterium]
MRSVIIFIGCLLLSGCCSKIGPQTVPCDSLAYNKAIQSSVDSQLLLNIVRLRYRDTPTFLQVGTVTSSYEFKRSASGELKLSDKTGENIAFTPKIGVDHTEKPTTIYQPLRGESFVKEMLSPIPLQTMTLLKISGWRIDRILRSCVQRMNTIQNAPSASGPTPETVPLYRDFLELAWLFRELELQDAVDFVPEKESESGQVHFALVLDKKLADPSVLNRIWQLLDLEEGADHIRLVPYHGKKHHGNEVVVDMRSPLSIFYFLSQGVHVPSRDEMWGKVTVTADDQGNRFDWGNVLDGLLTIHSGPRQGREPAILVNYRGVDFYIDDSDLSSKSTFSLLSQLLALQTRTPEIPAPLLTIPISN